LCDSFTQKQKRWSGSNEALVIRGGSLSFAPRVRSSPLRLDHLFVDPAIIPTFVETEKLRTGRVAARSDRKQREISPAAFTQFGYARAARARDRGRGTLCTSGLWR